MTYKTILVHCDGGGTMSHSLAVGADLATRSGAHLVGLHVRAPFQVPVYAEATYVVDSIYKAWEESSKAAEASARGVFGKTLQGKGLSTESRVADGAADREIALHARYADLTIVGQAGADNDQNAPDLPETVALATGRGVLVVLWIGTATMPGKTVMLCWNASREAARAVADAMPLLEGAAAVHVLILDPETSGGAHGAEPGADIATFLSRHGVKVTVRRESAPELDVGETILSRAADLGADLIVMGIYGHSRLREMVLGGASRTMLRSMTVPVLMAH